MPPLHAYTPTQVRIFDDRWVVATKSFSYYVRHGTRIIFILRAQQLAIAPAAIAATSPYTSCLLLS